MMPTRPTGPLGGFLADLFDAAVTGLAAASSAVGIDFEEVVYDNASVGIALIPFAVGSGLLDQAGI
ncbi:hypothetical protein [Dietzia sp. 179-F 9C3 NHS]|uniref:hypothetical protein n=1 Tax=Dietzia sp. 179-F 9C3 NHS TaxID=3374295 RepID=UPI00387A2529